MGDFFFILICLANAEDIEFKNHYKKYYDKYNTRDKDRWTKKEE